MSFSYGLSHLSSSLMKGKRKITRRVLQKFGSDAILAFKSPATKLTNQNCDDFGLYIARPEIGQSEFCSSTIFSVH